MNDDTKVQWTYEILIFILGCVVLFYVLPSLGNDMEYRAQDSMAYINRCFEQHNNSLECYHRCRTEQWSEKLCIKAYEDKYIDQVKYD